MAVVLPRLNRPASPAPGAAAGPGGRTSTRMAGARPPAASPAGGVGARADSVVAFGLRQRGTPYVWAGTSPLTGFDCSGFILFTFAHFGVSVPHSTALLIDVGRPVPRAEAQAGDIVVFTGTTSASTAPGHAGIVVSGRGEVPLRFVHASSARREAGVKVSQVEGTGYERRFLQVRRVLGPEAGGLAAAPAAPAGANPRAEGPVAALPPRTVRVAAPAPTTPMPRIRTIPLKAAPRWVQKPSATAARRKVIRRVPEKRIAPGRKVVPIAKPKPAGQPGRIRVHKRPAR